ncbi:MAG TPA: hypothetical protein VGP12_04490, partial [Nitrosospira sp.]|nr:hypothetical protein [Nitrosospira sp.]
MLRDGTDKIRRRMCRFCANYHRLVITRFGNERLFEKIIRITGNGDCLAVFECLVHKVNRVRFAAQSFDAFVAARYINRIEKNGSSRQKAEIRDHRAAIAA